MIIESPKQETRSVDIVTATILTTRKAAQDKRDPLQRNGITTTENERNKTMEDINSASMTSTLTNTVTGTTGSGVEKVRLQLYAQGLPNVSSGGTFIIRRPANPFAVITVLPNDPNENRYILGMTEVIKNSCNPRWVSSFDFDYDFRRNTRINIGICDEVKPNSEVLMGSAMFKFDDVLGSKGNVKGKHLLKGGSVFVRITPVPIVQDNLLTLCFHGIQIKNVEGIFGIVDPFFELLSQITSIGGNSKSWQPVYRSKRIDNDLNPKWKQFTINTNILCDGDYNKPIQFVLWDSNKKWKHRLMGSFEISVNRLLSQVRKDGKNIGRIIVVTTQIYDVNRNSINNNNLHIIDNRTAITPLPPPQMNSSISNVDPIPPPDTATTSSTTTASNGSNNSPTFSDKLNYPKPPPQQQQNQSSQPSSSSSFQNAMNTASTADNNSNSFNSNNYTPRSSQQSPSQKLSQSVIYQQHTSSSYQNQSIIPLPLPVVPPKRPKFIDYLTGGCELELSIAIDYSGNDGDPQSPGTLHYFHPDGALNDFEKALDAVGNVIARYNTDQKFPVIGFGAKYNGLIQHCFQVGNTSELNSLLNVLQAYRQVCPTGVTMSSPTLSEIIDYAADDARSKQGKSQRIGQQSYRILYVLADGAFTDVEQKKRSIINASSTPLSIVLVGIGTADITSMNFIDIFRTMIVMVVIYVNFLS